MKTYQDLIDHFADRPEIQEKLLINLNNYWPEKGGDLTKISPDPTLAISLRSGFAWAETEEGYDYWLGIHSELSKIEEL